MSFFSKLFSQKNKNDISKPEKILCNPYDTETTSVYGYYAKTIFLWAHNKLSNVHENEEYARYFLYECGIEKPSEYHSELIKEGYFEKAPIKSILGSLRISDLKEFLSSNGQISTGKKEVLIDRIIEYADDKSIKKLYTGEFFILSKKGKLFLEQHNDYILIHTHKNWNIDWKEYDLRHKPDVTFHETVLEIFNDRILQEEHNLGRNTYWDMYELFEEIGKREEALKMLLRVLYIDLSGFGYRDVYELYKSGMDSKQDVLESFDSIVTIAPGILSRIVEYKDIYNDDFIECTYEHKLPVQICDKLLFKSIIQAILDGSFNEEKVKEQLKFVYINLMERLIGDTLK